MKTEVVTRTLIAQLTIQLVAQVAILGIIFKEMFVLKTFVPAITVQAR